jgi:hypothetical protein
VFQIDIEKARRVKELEKQELEEEDNNSQPPHV